MAGSARTRLAVYLCSAELVPSHKRPSYREAHFSPLGRLAGNPPRTMVEHPFNLLGIADQPAKRDRMTVSYHRQSLQLCVLRLGLLQGGDVGVGVFPDSEEIIVGRTGLDLVAREDVGAPKLEMRQ